MPHITTKNLIRYLVAKAFIQHETHDQYYFSGEVPFWFEPKTPTAEHKSERVHQNANLLWTSCQP